MTIEKDLKRALNGIDKLVKKVTALDKKVATLSKLTRRNRKLAAAVPAIPGQHVSVNPSVLAWIKKAGKKGIGIPELVRVTGHGFKQVRNAVFRQNKLGNIKRKSRGIYVMA